MNAWFISRKPLAALLLLASLVFTGSALAANHENPAGKAADASKTTQGTDKKVVKVDDKKATKAGQEDAAKDNKDHSAHDAATHDKSK
ncbi:MAG: hypothetical protein A2051_09985 [Desulfovibrionales bacterium GWA2_65_9]|nr:MAG: hypothetical protein A2051_09985 [Desulfovibrionales bacterium GWA2_65_9]